MGLVSCARGALQLLANLALDAGPLRIKRKKERTERGERGERRREVVDDTFVVKTSSFALVAHKISKEEEGRRERERKEKRERKMKRRKKRERRGKGEKRRGLLMRTERRERMGR